MCFSFLDTLIDMCIKNILPFSRKDLKHLDMHVPMCVFGWMDKWTDDR